MAHRRGACATGRSIYLMRVLRLHNEGVTLARVSHRGESKIRMGLWYRSIEGLFY